MSEYAEYLPLAEMSDTDKLLKDTFIEEYVKDFNVIQACLRIGVKKTRVKSTGKKMLEDPYIADRLRVKIRAMDESDIVTRSEILNKIKFIAATSDNEETSLKAWGKLAKLSGMEVTYVRLENMDPAALPDLSEDLDIEDMATIYANEVING